MKEIAVGEINRENFTVNSYELMCNSGCLGAFLGSQVKLIVQFKLINDRKALILTNASLKTEWSFLHLFEYSYLRLYKILNSIRKNPVK